MDQRMTTTHQPSQTVLQYGGSAGERSWWRSVDRHMDVDAPRRVTGQLMRLLHVVHTRATPLPDRAQVLRLSEVQETPSSSRIARIGELRGNCELRLHQLDAGS